MQYNTISKVIFLELSNIAFNSKLSLSEFSVWQGRGRSESQSVLLILLVYAVIWDVSNEYF